MNDFEELVVEFTPATEQHFNDICSLVTSPEELYILNPYGTFPWDVEQLAEKFRTRVDHTVCVVDGMVCGYANLYDVKKDESAFIGNVVISDQYKGFGLGKKLISHMLELCQYTYNAVPHLMVFAHNTRALLIYTKMGFKPYDIESKQNLDGEQVALLHMRLEQFADKAQGS